MRRAKVAEQLTERKMASVPEGCGVRGKGQSSYEADRLGQCLGRPTPFLFFPTCRDRVCPTAGLPKLVENSSSQSVACVRNVKSAPRAGLVRVCGRREEGLTLDGTVEFKSCRDSLDQRMVETSDLTD